MYVWIGLGFLD